MAASLALLFHGISYLTITNLILLCDNISLWDLLIKLLSIDKKNIKISSVDPGMFVAYADDVYVLERIRKPSTDLYL